MAGQRGRKPKSKAARSAFSAKVSQLAHEGYDNPKQRLRIAYEEFRRGGTARLRQSHGKKLGHRRGRK